MATTFRISREKVRAEATGLKSSLFSDLKREEDERMAKMSIKKKGSPAKKTVPDKEKNDFFKIKGKYPTDKELDKIYNSIRWR